MSLWTMYPFAATVVEGAVGVGVNVTPDLTRPWPFFAAGVLLRFVRIGYRCPV